MKKHEGKSVILINKRRGETMGELLKRVRLENSLSIEEKITFAGRLDPMASGLVIFLYGDERFKKEEYLSLAKQYKFEIIFGIETDTGDTLGLVSSIDTAMNVVENDLRSELARSIRKHIQTYPAYSSKPVQGKPLFQHAREGRNVTLPKNEIEIYDLRLVKMIHVPKDRFLKEVLEDISLVNGDFRQREITDRWMKSEAKLPKDIVIASCVVDCSSGTYIRALAGRIANKLETVGIARHIHRTRIGEFTNAETIV